MEMLFYMLLMLISNINAAALPDTSPPGAVNGGPITCGTSIDANIPTQGNSIAYEFTQQYRTELASTFFSFSTCNTPGTSGIDTSLRVDADDGSGTAWYSLVIPGMCNKPLTTSQYCNPCKVSTVGEIMAGDLTTPNSGHSRWLLVTAASGSGDFTISLDCPTSAPTNNPTSPTSGPTTPPTTAIPTTVIPTTARPTTMQPSTVVPTTNIPTSAIPTTNMPTTDIPTTYNPTTIQPSTDMPTTSMPTTTKHSIVIPKSAAPSKFPTSNPVEQATEATETFDEAKTVTENGVLAGDSLLLMSIIGGCVASFCLGILITLFCVRKRNKQKEMDALDKEIKITVTSDNVTENGNTSNGTTTETEMAITKSIDISEDENDNEADGMYAQGSMNATGGQMNNNGKELVRLKSNESVEGGDNNVVQMTIGDDDSDDEMYQTELNQTAGQ